MECSNIFPMPVSFRHGHGPQWNARERAKWFDKDTTGGRKAMRDEKRMAHKADRRTRKLTAKSALLEYFDDQVAEDFVDKRLEEEREAVEWYYDGGDPYLDDDLDDDYWYSEDPLDQEVAHQLNLIKRLRQM